MCLVTGCPHENKVTSFNKIFSNKKDLCIEHAVRPSRELKKPQDLSPAEENSADFWLDDADSSDEKEESVGDVGSEEEEYASVDVKKAVVGVKLKKTGNVKQSTDAAAAVKNKRSKRHNKQSSEKRKEKSRDAARSRRSKESDLYNSLSDCLPLAPEVLANLDKASIMRIAIACLNTSNMITIGLQLKPLPASSSVTSESKATPGSEELLRELCCSGSSAADDDGKYQEALLQAVDGFVLVLSANGDVAFVSTSIADYLGLAQVDVMGASLYDLVHQCDHECLRQLLYPPQISTRSTGSKTATNSTNNSSLKRSSSTCSSSSRGHTRRAPRRSKSSASSKTGEEAGTSGAFARSTSPPPLSRNDERNSESYCEPRHGFLRMKCTLANKGRNVTIRNASYKVVEVSGKMVLNRSNINNNSNSGVATLGWLICVASPVPHPANIEVPLDKNTYFSKHSLDMKFTYADENFPVFCGFTPSQLEGQSLFQLHHELDGQLLRQAFVTLRAKGQVNTGQYRFLACGGGYVWLVTQATVIHAQRDSAPTAVVCLHYVISGVEHPEQILSCIQLPTTTSSSSSPEGSVSVSNTGHQHTGGRGVGFSASSSQATRRLAAVLSSTGQPQQQQQHAQGMLVTTPTTPTNSSKNNTAKTQQKTTERRGSGVLAGLSSSSVSRSVSPSPAILKTVHHSTERQPRQSTANNTNTFAIKRNNKNSAAAKLQQQETVITSTTQQISGAITESQPTRQTLKPGDIYATANNNTFDLIKKSSNDSNIPTIKVDSSYIATEEKTEDEQQSKPKHDGVCNGVGKVSSKDTVVNTKTIANDVESQGSGSVVSTKELVGCSSNVLENKCKSSVGWADDCTASCQSSNRTPLLSQAAQGLYHPQPQPPAQQEFVSSTASLFETDTSDCDQLGLNEGPLNNFERFLFSDSESSSASSSHLLPDLNLSELSFLSGAHPTTAKDMDIISATTLFKNEPFCDGEEYDARAPFLPLCDDENLIMWSPSLELDEESCTDCTSQNYANCMSNTSSGSSNSPTRHSSGDSSADSIYNPDGALNTASLRYNNTPANTPPQDTSNVPRNDDCLKDESCQQSSLLSELLQHNFVCSKTVSPEPPLHQPPPSNSCIDPNKIWPGHKNQVRAPSFNVTCKDEEMFEWEKLLQEDEPQDKYCISSPTLASATLKDVNASLLVSPSLSYSSSLSPAFSSLTPFSCSNSRSSVSPTSSSPCSPRPPDQSPTNTSKRLPSPVDYPQIPRKRLCSPHVDDTQLQKQQQMQQRLQQQLSKFSQRDAGKSGRKLPTTNSTPYIHQMLSPREYTASNRTAGKGRKVISNQTCDGTKGRRLVALPKIMALVPRIQMVRNRAPQNVFRVVTENTAIADGHIPITLATTNKGRTLLLRGTTTTTGDRNQKTAFVTASRSLKPVRLVRERNVMECIPTDDDGSAMQEDMKPATGGIKWYGAEDSYDWIELVEDNPDCNDGSTASASRHFPINFDSTAPSSSRPQQISAVQLSNSPVEYDDYYTQAAKCLLLPQSEYSPVTMMRLTQRDYDVNAPAPSDLLTGQQLLEALDKSMQ